MTSTFNLSFPMHNLTFTLWVSLQPWRGTLLSAALKSSLTWILVKKLSVSSQSSRNYLLIDNQPREMVTPTLYPGGGQPSLPCWRASKFSRRFLLLRSLCQSTLGEGESKTDPHISLVIKSGECCDNTQHIVLHLDVSVIRTCYSKLPMPQCRLSHLPGVPVTCLHPSTLFRTIHFFKNM